MDKLEQLRIERQKLNSAIYKIENAKKAKENAALVGKCFKYRNSYGSHAPSWWLYLKVVDVTNDGNLKTFVFQQCSENETRINPARVDFGTPQNSHIPIKASEFNKAWRAMQKRIAGMRP